MTDYRAQEKRTAVWSELRHAVMLLRTGTELLEHNLGQDRFIPFNFLIYNGLERLFKVTLLCNEIEKLGRYPSEPPWDKRKEGHNLQVLLNRVLRNCYPEDYIQKYQFATRDYEFLKDDDLFKELIRRLTLFAVETRYFNFDDALDKISESNYINNPDYMWIDLEKIEDLQNAVKKCSEAFHRLYISSNFSSFALSISTAWNPFSNKNT